MTSINLKPLKLLLFVIFQLFALSCAYAVEEIPDQSQVYKGEISFDKVLEEAKAHSFDLQIADFNILISKQGIRGARSEYFPKLNIGIGTEYTKNFRDANESTVMSIGESFINPYTRYQSVLGINLSYNLFDFGVRRGNLDIAKEDAALRELEEEEKWQEEKLNILDTYSKIIIAKKQADIYKDILALQEKNLEYKTRLFKAKEISKTELNSQTAEVSLTNKKINELNSIIEESLNWLTFYTGTQYDIKNLKISEIKNSKFDVNAFNDYTKSVTWKIHEKNIKKKELELKVAKRMNYPKVSFYSKYYLYGADHDSYPRSFGDIGPSNFVVGGYVNMPIFDGMKNRANIQKTYLELQQLNVERDKAIAQLMTRLSIMRSNLIWLDEQIKDSNNAIKELTDKEKSVKRLVSKRLMTPIDENEAKIELLQQKIELEKNRLSTVSITKGIEFLTEEG